MIPKDTTVRLAQPKYINVVAGKNGSMIMPLLPLINRKKIIDLTIWPTKSIFDPDTMGLQWVRTVTTL